MDPILAALISNYVNLLHKRRIMKKRIMHRRGEHMAKEMWHLSRRNSIIAMIRRIWKLNRSSTFWEERMSNGAEKFKNDFRMWPDTFEIFSNWMKCLERKDTTYREAIPLEKRIGIAVYALASSDECRSISNLFGVGRTTVGEIVLDFCGEVWGVMQGEFLSLYNNIDDIQLQQCVDGFEALGLLQCCVAIDGCHIAVSPPGEEAYDFYNFKGWHSVILLATVDYRYQFIAHKKYTCP